MRYGSYVEIEFRIDLKKFRISTPYLLHMLEQFHRKAGRSSFTYLRQSESMLALDLVLKAPRKEEAVKSNINVLGSFVAEENMVVYSAVDNYIQILLGHLDVTECSLHPGKWWPKLISDSKRLGGGMSQGAPPPGETGMPTGPGENLLQGTHPMWSFYNSDGGRLWLRVTESAGMPTLAELSTRHFTKQLRRELRLGHKPGQGPGGAGTAVGDAGVRAILAATPDLANLREISIHFHKLTAAGAAALAVILETSTALQTLDLEENHCGSRGAAVLAAALETNSTLTMLSLNGNRVSDAGAKALAAALRKNATLLHLKLGRNHHSTQRLRQDLYRGIGDAGVKALLSALDQNTTLQTLELNDILSDRDAEQPISAELRAAIEAKQKQGRLVRPVPHEEWWF